MRIGVIADNHRLVDPALPRILTGVDEIWHAGDLVTTDILAALRAIAPVQAVRGNNDQDASFRSLPEELLLEREGMRILLRHIVGKAPRIDRDAMASIARLSPAIVVMGHSHQPHAEMVDGIVYLNPGSCGPRRFSLPRCAATLNVSRKSVHFIVTSIDDESTLIDRSFVLPKRPS